MTSEHTQPPTSGPNAAANQSRFWTAYENNLREAVTTNPTGFAYGLDKVQEIATRMRNAWVTGSASKEGQAIKATCKQLKIRHTYTAINSFLKDH